MTVNYDKPKQQDADVVHYLSVREAIPSRFDTFYGRHGILRQKQKQNRIIVPHKPDRPLKLQTDRFISFVSTMMR